MKKKAILIASILGILAVFLGVTSYIRKNGDSADVVVIGAGASGMSAAIEAAEQGANVILLEKMPYVGGNTIRATAGMNAIGTSAQEKLGIEDSKEQYIKDVLVSGHSTNNEIMVTLMADESSSAYEWLVNMGADLSDLGILAGHSVPRTHRPSGGKPIGTEIVRVLKQKITAMGIDLRLENKATKILVNNDGDISGVTVIDRKGRTYNITSPKVIISTGGFGGSPEAFVYYNQKLKGYKTTNSPSATGDFIGLVEPLNVKLVDMSYIQTHPTVSYDYGMLITEAIRGNGGILVNNQGRRFANELENRDLLSEDILNQPDREVYLVFNEKIRNSLAASDEYIDMKIAHSAEDLETLADIIRVDFGRFSETIANYNHFVNTGYDLDYGRNVMSQTIEDGPYYAIQVIPGVHYCMGGILIDEKGRVISDENKIINGLFASGEVTGGIHGQNRLGGNSILDAVVFGRIAGRSAIK